MAIVRDWDSPFNEDFQRRIENKAQPDGADPEVAAAAIIGTVIHGTLLPYDLIEAFTTELEDRSVGENDPRIKSLIIEGNDSCALGRDAVNYPDNPDHGERFSELIHDLVDAIDGLAPEGVYFGAHEGDGADFGYWPVEDED